MSHDDAAAPAGWSRALAFASRHHGEALRKGTRVPYVTHVVAVAETLAYHHPDRDALVVAGLLHDVVEDTGASFDDVARTFGDEVAALVRAVSKDDDAMLAELGVARAELTAGLDDAAARAALWRARREFLLSHLHPPRATPDVLRLKAADVHANLTSILRDLRHPAVGARVWDRFQVGREASLWFYREVVAAVRAGLPGEVLQAAAADVLEAVERG
jgi:(p)ppGpp synthase/HD superfamily hydrolase